MADENENEQQPPQTKKQRTAEEVEAKLAQVRLQTAEVQLQQAQMQLEQTEEQIAQFKADKEARKRANKQRQSQLKIDINGKAAVARQCTHRQGGSLKNQFGGKGPSALQRVIMPQGERVLIMCSICPLRVWSPYPGDGSRKRRPGESQQALEARIEKYAQEVAEFQKLEEHSMDKLTEEAAAPMHCGKTFKFIDGDGNEVQVPAPCDRYAQGRDNRQGARP